MKRKIEKKIERGFTLLELMIVIVILGVLAALIVGNFVSSLRRGRDARRKADLEQIQRAVELYYEDKRAYPTAAAVPGFPFGSKFCETAACDSSEKVYMQKVSNDPSAGKNYKYDSDGTYFRLYACLENDQQVLPYVSQNYGSITCGNCKDGSGSTVTCIFGISSPNTNP